MLLRFSIGTLAHPSFGPTCHRGRNDVMHLLMLGLLDHRWSQTGLLLLGLLPGQAGLLANEGHPVLLGGSGQLQCAFYLSNGRLRTNQIFGYEFAVSNSLWAIRADLNDGVSRHAFYNGTNVFLTTIASASNSPSADVLKRYSLPTVVVTNPEAKPLPCELLPGNAIWSDYILNVPWLANLSGAYIRQVGLAQMPAPWEVTQHTIRAFYFRAEGKTFTDELGLPQIVQWRFSERQARSAIFRHELARELCGPDERKAQARASIRGDEHHIVAEYKILQCTNLFGVNVPEVYNLSRKIASQTGKAGEDIVILSITGKQVITGSPDLSLLALPASPKGFLVIDHRFRQESKLVDFIQYTTNNPTAASTFDERLQAAYSRKVAAAMRDPALTRRWPMYLALFVIVGFPIIILKWWRTVTSGKTTMQRKE